MFLAIQRIVEENGYAAVALSCWPKLMPKKGMSGCLINALLNNLKIPAGCEADVLGTVSMFDPEASLRSDHGAHGPAKVRHGGQLPDALALRDLSLRHGQPTGHAVGTTLLLRLYG